MDAVREFLAALQTERGASPHTLAAYRRDLAGFTAFLTRHGALRGSRAAWVT